MGLRYVGLVAFVLTVASCAGIKEGLSPADPKAVNQTWRFDCCDPGLDEATKWMCDEAIKNPDHALKDADGNRYEMLWSDCAIGQEPWRKYE